MDFIDLDECMHGDDLCGQYRENLPDMLTFGLVAVKLETEEFVVVYKINKAIAKKKHAKDNELIMKTVKNADATMLYRIVAAGNDKTPAMQKAGAVCLALLHFAFGMLLAQAPVDLAERPQPNPAAMEEYRIEKPSEATGKVMLVPC